MSRIKLCGLRRVSDIEAANRLLPDYIGFVFAKSSRRYIQPEDAVKLKNLLCPDIRAVGVFVDEAAETIAEMLARGVIDFPQLHGNESEEYIERLKARTGRQVMKAYRVESLEDIRHANESRADIVLLDSGGGTGVPFPWEYLKEMNRPYFLAGGLNLENIHHALKYAPYGVDVSSGIETDGYKDPGKMAAFVAAVRKAGRRI